MMIILNKSDYREAKKVFTKERDPNTNKGDYGKVYIVGGCKGMTGSVMLCAKSALRSGAGLVYIVCPGSLLPIYESGLWEPVKIPVGSDRDEYFTPKHSEEVFNAVKGADCLILGPGLGRKKETEDFVIDFVRRFCKDHKGGLILDADGLNAFQNKKRELKEAFALRKGGMPAALTPHPLEMMRLMGYKTVEEVNNNRIITGIKAAGYFNSVVLLKGHRTVIVQKDRDRFTVAINPTGNPGMATAGSGDVLAGIIGGLYVTEKSDSMFDAVKYGALIHGKCGDLAAAKMGQRSVISGDIIDMIPEIYNEKD